MTKELNATIRAECATGLGRIGVSAFRTLLLSLSDGEQIVRDAVSRAILRNMTPEEVRDEFSSKQH